MKSESIQANANNIYHFFCLDKEQKLVQKQWTWPAGCHGSCFYNLLQAVICLRISRNSWNLFKYVRSDEIAVMKFDLQLPAIRSCEKKCWAPGRWGEASSKKILSRAAVVLLLLLMLRTGCLQSGHMNDATEVTLTQCVCNDASGSQAALDPPVEPGTDGSGETKEQSPAKLHDWWIIQLNIFQLPSAKSFFPAWCWFLHLPLRRTSSQNQNPFQKLPSFRNVWQT